MRVPAIKRTEFATPYSLDGHHVVCSATMSAAGVHGKSQRGRSLLCRMPNHRAAISPSLIQLLHFIRDGGCPGPACLSGFRNCLVKTCSPHALKDKVFERHIIACSRFVLECHIENPRTPLTPLTGWDLLGDAGQQGIRLSILIQPWHLSKAPQPAASQQVGFAWSSLDLDLRRLRLINAGCKKKKKARGVTNGEVCIRSTSCV